jgi:hypothetical protein
MGLRARAVTSPLNFVASDFRFIFVDPAASNCLGVQICTRSPGPESAIEDALML